jgi:hypothetical protein
LALSFIPILATIVLTIFVIMSFTQQPRSGQEHFVLLACCRFGGHRDRMFPPIGGPQCNEGSSAASSSLRR